MYHFVADQPPEPLVLSAAGKTQVPGHICQYLKSFQIEAIRFLHTHLAKRELCVLNDETGLGKTACVAACLAATLAPRAAAAAVGSGSFVKRKKCLIVVQNDDASVSGWRFHFDVLTTASVTVINGAKDSTKSTHNVYIAKWGTLRSLGDLSKLNFDFVVLDNRGQMLNNNFCTSMLLKNYEKKVNIVISSIDITSDIKLLHNILRLGGRLEQQYESFKVFETKFKLPDSKEVFNNKNTVDLEEYFQKREVLNYYCKKFRMRRYRHQYEHMLPLVEADRYQINLKLWSTATLHSNSNSDRTVETIASSENGTEELFDQFHSIKSRQGSIRSKPLELTPLSTPSTPSVIISGGGGGDEQNVVISSKSQAIDISETPLVMSPLLFVSDSESESKDADAEEDEDEEAAATVASKDAQHNRVGEIVDLTSESINIVMIEESEPPPRKLSAHKVARKDIEEPKASPVASEKRRLRSQRKSLENRRPKRKQEKPQNLAELKNNRESLRKLQKPNKVAKGGEKARITATRFTKKSEANLHATSNVEKDQPSTPSSRLILKMDSKSKTSPLLKPNKQKSNDNDLRTPKRTLRNTAASNNNKTERKKTPAKHKDTKTKAQLEEKEKHLSSTNKNDDQIVTAPESSKTLTTASPAPTAKNKRDKSQINITSNFGARTMAITPKGTRMKMTRSMQRMTRSKDASIKNKYMLTNLALNIDKKSCGSGGVGTKRRKTSPQKNRDAETKENKVSKIATAPAASKNSNKPSRAGIKLLQPKVKRPLPSPVVKSTTKTNNSRNLQEVTSKTTVRAARKFSQNSVISTSEYEDMQCGQKLTLESSSENSAVRMLEKPPLRSTDNDFLIPPTPYSTRTSQYTLPSLFIESEVIFVPSSSAANKRTQDAIVVMSSQDEGSLSSSSQQSRRTRALKRRMTTPMATAQRSTTATSQRLPTFGELLAKQQTATAATTLPQRRTSPDLFSNFSDLEGIGGLECTQEKNHNKNNSGTSSNSSNNRTPFDGFKIFGSEVKQFQQKHAATAAAAVAAASSTSSTTKVSRDRSCLDILEKMFEPRTQPQQNTTMKTTSATQPHSAGRRRAKTPILPAHPIQAIANTQKEEEAAAAVAAATTTQRAQRKRPLLDEDIFEISNNGTFGSVMRLNSNGEISPVVQQQLQKQSQHNKITNYYIGSVTTQPGGTPTNIEVSAEEQPAGTPSKNRMKEHLQSGTAMRKSSPKSAKSQQATKLTRWFLKNATGAGVNARSNSVENSHTEDEIEEAPRSANVKVEQNSEIDLEAKKKTRSSTTKRRRRLELSFKN